MTSKEEIKELAKRYHKEVEFLETPLEITVSVDGETAVRKIYSREDLKSFAYEYQYDYDLKVYKTGIPHPEFESLAFPFFTHHIHQLKGESHLLKLFHYLDNLFAGRLLFGIAVSAIQKIEILIG